MLIFFLKTLVGGFVLPTLIIFLIFAIHSAYCSYGYYSTLSDPKAKRFRNWSHRDRVDIPRQIIPAFWIGVCLYLVVGMFGGVIMSSIKEDYSEYDYTITGAQELTSMDDDGNIYTYRAFEGESVYYTYLTLSSDGITSTKNYPANDTVVVYSNQVPHVEKRIPRYGDWREWFFVCSKSTRAYLYIPEGTDVAKDYIMEK